MIVGKVGTALAAGACVVITLAGCKGTTTIGPTTYVTVPAPRPTSSAPPSTTPAPSPRPTKAAAAMSKLPGRCDALLPLGSIVNAIGRTVGGSTAFVLGQPDPTMDRVTYINCRYGVSKKKKAAPTIEIGVSLYRSAERAEARIRPTVEDFAQHAATASETRVEGMPATVLAGGTGAGYGPTIVLAVGQRTIAVSFRPGAVASPRLVKDLVALAALAAERTSVG